MAKMMGETMNQKTLMMGIKRKIKAAIPTRDNSVHDVSQRMETIFFSRVFIVFSRIYPG